MSTKISSYPFRTHYLGTWRGRASDLNTDYYMFQKRYEPETLYEDVSWQMWNYQRDALRDYSGDTNTLFEHEIAPTNRFSGAKVNMRVGGTGYYHTASPLIYDGNWIWGHMDHDPRGWTSDPRWDEMRRNNENRYLNHPFADSLARWDEPEQNPGDRISKLRWWMDYLRNTHYLAFETSEKNLIKGGPSGVYNDVALTEKIVDQISRTPQKTLQHKSTATLSNDVRLPGHLMVPDHRVKVARYGTLQGMAPLTDHQSAVAITKYDPGIFRDSALMSSIAAKLRKTSEARSLIEKIVTEAKPDSTNISPKSMRMISNIISLMGLTEYDLKDTSITIEPMTSPDFVLNPAAKDLVDILIKMPDSSKQVITSNLLSHIHTALKNPRQMLGYISHTQKSKDSALLDPATGRVPDQVISNLNKYVMGMTPKDQILNKVGITPDQLPDNQTITKQSILSRDTTKKAAHYGPRLAQDHVKVQPNVEAATDIQKFNMYSTLLLSDDPMQREEYTQPSEDNRVQHRKMQARVKPPGPDFSYESDQYLTPYEDISTPYI